jgi:hypothetical protein
MTAPKSEGAAGERVSADGDPKNDFLPGDQAKNNSNDNQKQEELREHDELRLHFIGAKFDASLRGLYAAHVCFGVGDFDAMHDCLRRFVLDTKMLVAAANEHRRQMRARAHKNGGAA